MLLLPTFSGERFLLSDETKTELLGHNEKSYFWKSKGEALIPENTVLTVKHNGGSIIQLGLFCCQ